MTTVHGNLSPRPYRLAQGVAVSGILALGTLVVDSTVDRLHAPLFGASPAAWGASDELAALALPVTFGQLAVAVIGIIGALGFVVAEFQRVRAMRGCNRRCSEAARAVLVASRLRGAELRGCFARRSAAFAGLLFALWLLQSSFERWLGGLEWGMPAVGASSLLPLVALVGLCIAVGMVLAGCSMVGLRAIAVLEQLLQDVIPRASRAPAQVVRLGRVAVRQHFADRFGCAILSRPPPSPCPRLLAH